MVSNTETTCGKTKMIDVDWDNDLIDIYDEEYMSIKRKSGFIGDHPDTFDISISQIPKIYIDKLLCDLAIGISHEIFLSYLRNFVSNKWDSLIHLKTWSSIQLILIHNIHIKPNEISSGYFVRNFDTFLSIINNLPKSSIWMFVHIVLRQYIEPSVLKPKENKDMSKNIHDTSKFIIESSKNINETSKNIDDTSKFIIETQKEEVINTTKTDFDQSCECLKTFIGNYGYPNCILDYYICKKTHNCFKDPIFAECYNMLKQHHKKK
jgi:hypothetical protein